MQNRTLAQKLFSGMVVFLLITTLSAGAAKAETPLNIKLITGAAGGIFYIQAGVISEIIKKAYPGSQINAVPGGALGNLGVVSKGIADIGLTHINYYPLALKGTPPFTQKFENVRAIMKHGYYSYGQIFISDSTGATSFQELKERKYPLKLATTTKSGASYWMTLWLLEAYGIKLDDLEKWGGKVLYGSMNDAVNWFRDGQVNAWGGGGQLPSNAPLQISQIAKVRLLSVDEEHMAKLLTDIEGAEDRMIPSGTYPRMVNSNENVRTIAEPGGIIVRKDLPDDVVYKITKALVESEQTIREGAGMSEFDPKTAWKNIGPLHPGAAKYFKERGWMK